MKAYYKERIFDDRKPVQVLLFLDEDNMIVNLDGTFAYGLHAKEGTGHKTIKQLAKTENTAGTGYREIEVDEPLARKAIRLGKMYRTVLDKKGILPLDAELRKKEEKDSLLYGSRECIPKDFQEKAKELYESAGIKL